MSSVRKGFESKTGIIEMHVLRLLGKLLTGPWMQFFYISGQSDLSHIYGTKVVKGVLSALGGAAANPRNILDRTTDLEKIMIP